MRRRRRQAADAAMLNANSDVTATNSDMRAAAYRRSNKLGSEARSQERSAMTEQQTMLHTMQHVRIVQ
jgi:hypothetical protein